MPRVEQDDGGPTLNRHEKKAAEKLRSLLDVPLSKCEELVHEIVLATTKEIDIRRK